MPKPLILISFLIVPVVLIIAGLYFSKDLLTSIGCVVLIFYIIMLIRGKFSADKNNE